MMFKHWRERPSWGNEKYLREDTLVAANAMLVAALNRLELVHA